MNIVDKINQEQTKFIAEKRYKPKHVYLGGKEMAHLCIWAQNEFCYKTRPNASRGIEFLGMRVHEIKEYSHFNLA